MYESLYGFTGKPFQLNPDPQFYFDSRQHRRAMAFLDYGLHQSEGFIVITGEVGAGKTTVVRNLLSRLNPGDVVAASLVSTQLDAEDTLRMVGAAFGIRTRDMPKSDLLLSLEALLASQARNGKRCLLIVDEAQNLTPRAVEELRMLSNFQLGTHALLQSFLVGQPEFRAMMQGPNMTQLRQRVIASCHIGPLDPDDTRSYIEHRLRRVGWRDLPFINAGAFEAIHEASGGIPRRINLLCDRLLLSGFLENRKVFSEETVREVVEEMRGETLLPPLAAPQTPDVPSPPAVAFKEGEIVDVDFAHRKMQPAPKEHAYTVVTQSDSTALEGQLENVKHAIRDMESTLTRIDRGNQATLALFRRFLDWVRSRDRGPDDRS